MKCKRLGATTAQPQSGRPQKLTERDHRVLKHVPWKKIVCRRLQHSLPCSKLTLEATSAQALFIESFMNSISMAKQPPTHLRSPCAMPSVGWSGVKLPAIGLSSSGNTFSGVMNHASPSSSPTDESGFEDARRMLLV